MDFGPPEKTLSWQTSSDERYIPMRVWAIGGHWAAQGRL